MTESQVVNEWISLGERKGMVISHRQKLLELLEARFPSLVPPDVVGLIDAQDSLTLLDGWFRVALRADTIDPFLGAVQR